MTTQSMPPQAMARQPRDEAMEDTRLAWSEFLRTLPADAHILDAGFGNHVPALIAADLALGQSLAWKIHAIDTPTGSNDSANAALHALITFTLPDVPGRLPYTDGCFHAACGHHLLDHYEPISTLTELRRVLAPGADLQFIVHHAQSALASASVTTVEEAELVFGNTKAFRRLHRLLTMQHAPSASIERADADVRNAIRTLKAALPAANARGGGRVLAVALDAIRKLLTARRELQPALAGLAVDRAEADLRDSVRKVASLAAGARTPEQMDLLVSQAGEIGFSRIESVARRDSAGQPLSWQLLMHRP